VLPGSPACIVYMRWLHLSRGRHGGCWESSWCVKNFYSVAEGSSWCVTSIPVPLFLYISGMLFLKMSKVASLNPGWDP
jgi:hypothetical protein